MTDEPLFFDPDRDIVRRRDPWTSHQAAMSLTPSARGKECEDVYWCIWTAADGLTTAEIVARLSWDRGRPVDRGNTARRITDLRQAGRIRNSGRTRPGPTGRPGIVWEAA